MNKYSNVQRLVSILSRHGYSEYKDDLPHEQQVRQHLQKLNNKVFTENEFNEIMLALKSGTIEDNYFKLREGLVINDNIVRLIDFNNIKNNKIEFKSGRIFKILINGLPIVSILISESGESTGKLFKQITYIKRKPNTGLESFIQFYIISNGDYTKYFANTSGALSLKLAFTWSDEKNIKYNSIEEFSENFLSIDHVFKMIKEGMVFNHGNKRLIILRPYQYYAIKATVSKVLNTDYIDILPESIDHNGYIWHSTGSGKTLTSFKVSQILAENNYVEKVVFLVDRRDLDTQTVEEFNKFKKNSVNRTSSTDFLVDQLKDKKEKLVLTTIQKMDSAVKNNFEEIEFLRDKRIVFIIDECHRSQCGSMHVNIRKHFEKGQYIGFTGTPIFEQNSNSPEHITSKLFGECLHNYVLFNAIDDKNVLPFNIEYIKTISQKEGSNLDLEKAYAIDKKEVLEAEDRLTSVACNIIDIHDKKTKNRKYSALFAVPSINIAIKYYEIFKELDHDLKISTIYSSSKNPEEDSIDNEEDFPQCPVAQNKNEPNEDDVFYKIDKLREIMDDYQNMFGMEYQIKNEDEFKRLVSKHIKLAELDILIVVDMLLTGFDAQMLQTLYVDKNMKNHGLIQSFSRTNRLDPSGELKAWGNIVCYRPLKERVDEAIILFNNNEDLDNVVAKDMEHYEEIFKEDMLKVREMAPEPTQKYFNKINTDELKLNYINAFKKTLKTMNTLESFVKFEFNEEKLGVSEEDYGEYIEYYEKLYADMADNRNNNKSSILNDVEFNIELVGKDYINFNYIMHLLEIDPSEKRRRDLSMKVRGSNDPDLKYKKELLIKFIENQIIEEGDDVKSLYEYFRAKERNEKLEEFAKTNDLSKVFLERQLSNIIMTERIIEKDIAKELSKFYRVNNLENNNLKELTVQTINFLHNIYYSYIL